MSKTIAAVLPALIVAAAFVAPASAQSEAPPQKWSFLVTFGDDPCPEAEGDEIIVCAARPESERYRVPRELREEIRDEYVGGAQSWSSAVESYDDIARVGRPGSCSPVGSFGFSGCAAAALRDWFAARRAR